MNYRQHQRLACSIAEGLLSGYLNGSDQLHDWEEFDPDKLKRALEELRSEMWRRSGESKQHGI